MDDLSFLNWTLSIIKCFNLDASDDCGFAYKAGSFDLTSSYLFKPEEREMSSGARELIAVQQAFSTFDNFLRSQRGSVILWMTDSQVCFSFLTRGSKIPAIQKILLGIKIKEYEYNLKIVPKWVSRNDYYLELADKGSKLDVSTEEYGVEHKDFMNIQETLDFICTVDGFASSKCMRTHKFISLVPQKGALDVDFFTHNLSSVEYYYLHPPVSCIQRTISKLVIYNEVHALVVMPVWPSHYYWNSILNGTCFQWFVEDFMIFRPLYVSFSKKGMFRGYKNFPTLVLKVNTAARNAIPLPDFSQY